MLITALERAWEEGLEAGRAAGHANVSGTRGKKKHKLEGKKEPGENSLAGMEPQAGPGVQVKDCSSCRENRTKGFTALQTQICFGVPRTGDSAPCDPCANTQMEDPGAKTAPAMLRKASHNNPSPSGAEGEISRHQEGTGWCVSALHGSRRKRFAPFYCICVER